MGRYRAHRRLRGPDGPAAGKVLVGDRLLSVQGQRAAKYIYDEEGLQSLLRGAEGSTCHLQLMRGGLPVRAPLQRADQPTPPEVVAMRWPGTHVAVLRIVQFDEGTAAQARGLLGSLLEDGITHVLLDLRGNPGGLVREAQQLAALFLDAGDAFCTTGAS